MAQYRLVAEGEEGSASRRGAEGDRAAHYKRGAEQVKAEPLGLPATLSGRTRLGGRGNSGTHAQRLLNMQRTHGNRALQRNVQAGPPSSGWLKKLPPKTQGPVGEGTWDQMVPGPDAAVQRRPMDWMEPFNKYMIKIPWLENIKMQLGLERASTDAQPVDDAKALEAAERAITGHPPLESAPPMVPVPALTPDPHRDFPGEGALEYRNVSPQLDWFEHPMYGW